MAERGKRGGLAGKVPGGIPGMGGGGMGSSTKTKVAMAKAAKGGGMSMETAATLAKAFK